jgi:hypothetical protein
MLTELTNLVSSSLGGWEALIRIGASVVASALAFFLYQIFYGSSHIGAGVHRTFLIGGPAIATIFLIIQTSLPLGLGLLGALSFVRFRTPVKDPAEIGFLLLLIAASIGVATGNLIPVAILFALVTVTLGVQRFMSNRMKLLGTGHLMISIDQPSFPGIEQKLTVFLTERLCGLRLTTMSTMENRVGLHYQYRKQANFNWTAFTNELNALAGEAKVEVFVG